MHHFILLFHVPAINHLVVVELMFFFLTQAFVICFNRSIHLLKVIDLNSSANFIHSYIFSWLLQLDFFFFLYLSNALELKDDMITFYSVHFQCICWAKWIIDLVVKLGSLVQLMHTHVMALL